MSTELNIAGARNYKTQRLVGRIILYFFLVILAIVCILPFWIMIVNATYDTPSLNKGFYMWFGGDVLENYDVMQKKVNIFLGFYNSVMITVPFVAISAYFSALTAYGLAKYKFRGSKVLFGVIIGTMMVPAQLGLIGYYMLCNTLKITNTYWPLILGGFSNAGTTFFIKMYIDSTVSDSLIEAARIDGSGEFFTFNRIILPIITPALATFSIFNFIGMWNNYIGPLVLIPSKRNLQPLPVTIASIRGFFEQNLGAIYLGVAISVVPIIIAFIFLSRYIIGGITIGSVKE